MHVATLPGLSPKAFITCSMKSRGVGGGGGGGGGEQGYTHVHVKNLRQGRSCWEIFSVCGSGLMRGTRIKSANDTTMDINSNW